VRAGDLQGGEIIRCQDGSYAVALRRFGEYRAGIAIDF
jgi:hypothetical protein